MIGWVPPPGDDAKPFLLPAGRATCRRAAVSRRAARAPDLDHIAGLKPDLILDFGSIGANYVALAEKVQKGTHIPYALIDGRLDRLPKTLRLAGDVAGRSRSAPSRLPSMPSRPWRRSIRCWARCRAASRPRFYLARGGDGLQSAVKGAGLTEVLERAGGINVAEGPAERGGAIEATFDKLAAWKPDVIVAFDKAAADAVRSDAGWKKITSGRRVLIAPTLPWGWLGEPPSVNQLLGLRWLASAFYPTEAKVDLAAETRAFHRLFYGVTPSDAQLAALTEGAS